MSEKESFEVHEGWIKSKVKKDKCPFCDNPKKSHWYYDDGNLVVADDAEKPDCLILFPLEHYPQWVIFGTEKSREYLKLLTGIARVKWGRNVKYKIDWKTKIYEHAHIQLTMIKPEWIKGKGIIVTDAKVGKGTQVWHYVILFKCSIGTNCIIGSHAEIGGKIGNGCKIQYGAFIPRGVVLSDDVFIGPNVTFTNDYFPRALGNWEIEPTYVGEGASIGANATICCGITIGKKAMVGCGAVVIKDVPDNAKVVGNPARIIGYVKENP